MKGWIGALIILLFVVFPATAAPTLSVLHAFGVPESASANPAAELIQASNGSLYGTTLSGGAAGQGSLFVLQPDGSSFRVLTSFGQDASDGSRPAAAVIESTDGALYGTTSEGGQFGYGSVFRLGKDGSGFAILKSFTGNDGAYPEGRLLEGSDGLLYGTASGGGTNDYGVVFSLAKDGSSFTNLFKFAGTNGANPEAGLIEASDGFLYGTTCFGGQTNVGTVFRLSKDGTSFNILKHLLLSPQTNGYWPQAGLVEGTNGVLYGTTWSGGTYQFGTLFRLNKDGTSFSILHYFGQTSTDGRSPLGELVVASNGWLYGTTSDGGTNSLGAIFRIDHQGSNYTVLASFTLASSPMAALLEANDGNLYGTSRQGGVWGDGTVFKLAKDGTGFSTLRDLSSTGGDGQSPYAAPALGSDGRLYGTTRGGGDQASGSVFSLRLNGLDYHLLSSFSPGIGYGPMASVVEGTNGALFGATQLGGAAGNGGLFTVQKDGSGLALVYSPPTSANGREPRASLIQASDGAFYGTTTLGGNNNQGTLFKVNADGSAYTVLEHFASGSPGPGANPMQALVEASNGQLYGVTYFGGGPSNNGALFTLRKDTTNFTALKLFGNPLLDGANPDSPLLEASDGKLYGTTYGGGSTNNAGAIFSIKKDGTGFQLLRAFIGLGDDGRHPSGRLVEGSDGALYGTTERGGTNDQGTLFRISKDGTGYATLVSFGDALGEYPRGGVTLGADGSIYTTTDRGGPMDLGLVVRFGEPLEEIIQLQWVAGYPSLTCLGVAGTNYWVERTEALAPPPNWIPLYSTNAPAGGKFAVLDASPLPGTAFYRLRR